MSSQAASAGADNTAGTPNPEGTNTAAADGNGDTAAAAAAAAAGGESNAAAGNGDAAAAAAAASGTEGQPAGDQPAGPPEKYELALPEGGVVDQTDIDEIAAMAKSNGLTNEEAQAALIELNASLTAQSTRFLERTQSHPEIGGTKLEAAQQNALRALEHFLPAASAEGQEFRAAMNKSGYGNYAPFVLLMSRIGLAMREDRGLNAPASAGGARKSGPDLFYGKR